MGVRNYYYGDPPIGKGKAVPLPTDHYKMEYRESESKAPGILISASVEGGHLHIPPALAPEPSNHEV